MKIHLLALALGVGLTGLAAPLSIADDDDSWGWQMWGWQRGGGQMMGGPGMMGGQMFGVIDANNDGVISADEAAGQREAVFYAMDTDSDGELTEEEYMSVRMGRGPGLNQSRMEAMQARKKERFAAMDADRNGTVSQAEFMAEEQKRFAAADTDNDGKVTPWEFRAQRWQ